MGAHGNPATASTPGALKRPPVFPPPDEPTARCKTAGDHLGRVSSQLTGYVTRWPEWSDRSGRRKCGFSGQFDGLVGGACRDRTGDLRNAMMAGGNILSLRDLLGHHDVKVTQKYAHLAPDHLAAEAARVSFRPVAGKAGKVVALAELK